MSGRVQTGTSRDVAAELRLHGIAAEAMGERSIIVRGTALGDILVWTRRDRAHFVDPLSYPRPMVPVVDMEAWETEMPRPRVLLVASVAVRTIIVCPVKVTRSAWSRGVGDVERASWVTRPAWCCPREMMQPFGWLKKHLLGCV